MWVVGFMVCLVLVVSVVRVFSVVVIDDLVRCLVFVGWLVNAVVVWVGSV